jgi:hypothetical protein
VAWLRQWGLCSTRRAHASPSRSLGHGGRSPRRGTREGCTRSAIVSSTTLQWRWPSSTGRRPVGGALAPVADHHLGIWGLDPFGCLWFRHGLSGAWQERKGITSLGRDARGLTFSAVIPAQVMQPGIATRGKHEWRMALCDYGMAFAPHHRVHVGFVAFRAHLRCGTGSGDPWPDSLRGQDPGWLPGLPSTST